MLRLLLTFLRFNEKIALHEQQIADIEASKEEVKKRLEAGLVRAPTPVTTILLYSCAIHPITLVSDRTCVIVRVCVCVCAGSCFR